MNLIHDYLTIDELKTDEDEDRFHEIKDLRNSIEQHLDETGLFMVKIQLHPNKKVIK